MVKMKQADYVELHRIVTNLSPRTVWQMMGDGRTVDSICAEIPDEFHDYVKEIARGLLEEASSIMLHVKIKFQNTVMEMKDPWSRKEFALKVSKDPNAKYLFLMWDGKNIEPVVWQNIKPRGDVKSLVKEDV